MQPKSGTPILEQRDHNVKEAQTAPHESYLRCASGTDCRTGEDERAGQDGKVVGALQRLSGKQNRLSREVVQKVLGRERVMAESPWSLLFQVHKFPP